MAGLALVLSQNVPPSPAPIAGQRRAPDERLLPEPVGCRVLGVEPDERMADLAERWRFDWDRPYSRDERLDQVPTFGGRSQMPPAALEWTGRPGRR